MSEAHVESGENIISFAEYHKKRQEAISAPQLAEVVEHTHSDRAAIEERLLQDHATKVYHNLEHSKMIASTAKSIASMLVDHDPSLSNEQRELIAEAAEYAGIIHDLIIKARKQGLFTVRNRGWDDPEGNEYQSFVLGVRIMLERYQVPGISAESSLEDIMAAHVELKAENPTYAYFMDEVEDGVRATMPVVNPMAVYPAETNFVVSDGTTEKDVRAYLRKNDRGEYVGVQVAQPNLFDRTPRPSYAGLSVAIADIGACAYASDPGRFFAVGDKEMLESKPQLAIDFETALNGGMSEEHMSTKVVGEIQGWINDQVGFALWFKEYYTHVLSHHDALQNDRQKQELEHFLRHQDTVILAAAERADEFKAVMEMSYISAKARAERILEFLNFSNRPGDLRRARDIAATAADYAEELSVAA